MECEPTASARRLPDRLRRPDISGSGVAEHGMAALREHAVAIVEAGLVAADPGRAAEAVVRRDGNRLIVCGRVYDLDAYRYVWLIGAGKASGAIAQVLEERLGESLYAGLVVVRRGSALPMKRVTVIEADHPVPSSASHRAADALMRLASEVGPEDLVLSAMTGGSSALVCGPASGITLEEKRELHHLLLSSGAAIDEINTVRKHTSYIKGGRLADAMHPKAIINLTVSDVAGDQAEFICDLTVQNAGTAGDAIDVLKRYGLWRKVASSIRTALTSDPSRSLPDLDGIDIATHIVVSGERVGEAMRTAAASRGLHTFILGTELSGPAEGVGVVLAQLARESARRGQPFTPPAALIACGGEATVQLTDDAHFGAGGPNQELAAAAATRLGLGDPVAVLAIDSDGSDGGTEASGGLVDGTSRATAQSVGVDLAEAVRQHRTYRALEAIDDLFVTGPTQTNVNDIVVVVIGDRSERDHSSR